VANARKLATAPNPHIIPAAHTGRVLRFISTLQKLGTTQAFSNLITLFCDQTKNDFISHRIEKGNGSHLHEEEYSSGEEKCGWHIGKI
jgi:hypothetical protein